MKRVLATLVAMFTTVAALSNRGLAQDVNSAPEENDHSRGETNDLEDQKLMECLERGIEPTFCLKHPDQIEFSHSQN